MAPELPDLPPSPPELAFLGAGLSPAARDEGWSAFVARFTRLLLRTTREFGGDYDAQMDRYRYVLDALRQDDFRKLRAFRPVSGSSVAAWLVVVARRLCLDRERANTGRQRSENPNESTEAQRRLRRALNRLGAGEFDPGDILPSGRQSPDEALREHDLHRALASAFRRLTPRHQLVLRLRFDDALSIGEIAEILGQRNVFQVYRQLRTSLAELRRHLERAGVTDAEP